MTGNNPLKGLNRVPHDRPKESRALTKGEVQRLFDASPQHWRDVWYAFLVTGMRATELASLRLSDVDWAARKLVVRRGIAKNHKPRRIPIDNELFRILDTLAKGRPSDRRAFTNTKGGPLNRHPLYQVFMRCCRRAEIQTRTLGPEGLEAEHVDVHSLRRTFATDLIENGADPKTVQDLLGHKTLAMTIALYAKVRPGTKRQAIGRLSSGAGADTPEQPIEFKAG